MNKRLCLAVGAAVFVFLSRAVFGETLVEGKLPPAPLLISAWGDVGDEPALFVLDTGSTDIMLNDSFLPLMRSEPTSRSGRVAGGRVIELSGYRSSRIAIRKLELVNPLVFLGDLGGIGRKLGVPFDGILGISGYDRFHVFFDYTHGRFIIHNGGWLLTAERSQEVALLTTARAPTIAAEIGGLPVALLVDTGNTASLALEHSLFDELVGRGLILPSGKVVQAYGADGNDRYQQGYFTGGILMGQSLRGVQVDSNPSQSWMGLAWLARMDFEISFPDRRFRYRPRTGDSRVLAPDIMTGLDLVYDQRGAIIVSISADQRSAARQSDLRVGDIIESVSVQTKDRLDAYKLAEEVRTHAGGPLLFTVYRMSTGQRFPITLQLPPPIYDENFLGHPPQEAEKQPAKEKLP